MKKTICIPKLYLCMMFFTPSFFGYLDMSPGQLLYLTVYFVFSLFFILISRTKNIIFLTELVPFAMIFAFHYAASSIINFKINKFGIGDLIEIMRPCIYLASFLVSAAILQPYARGNGIRRVLDYIENLVMVFSCIEFFKFIENTKYFFYLFTPFPYRHINYIRFSGFTGFAYAYAWILLICIVFHTVKTKGKLGFCFFYYSFLVLLTGSRTGILGLIVLYFFLFVLFRKIRIRLLLLFIFLLMTIFILYQMQVQFIVTSIDYVFRLINAFLGNENDGSLTTRRKQISEAFARFSESPLFGSGSNKSEDVRIENFYFHHLAAWGVIGLVLYIFWLAMQGLKLSVKNRTIYFLILIVSFILSFSSPIFDQVRIFNIFYAIIAVLLTDTENYQLSYAERNILIRRGET